MNYPPGMTLRPIEAWPGNLTTNRGYSRFESSLTDTLKLLDRELRLLDPKDPSMPDCVMQIALREQDFRTTDGMPRASAKPDHPGVILSIETAKKPALSFPCDTFLHWHDNLRAIALTLEALRKIDRYGVTQTGQQYRGWQAIEAAPDVDAKGAATSLLIRVSGHNVHPDAPPVGMAEAYRRARRNAHPDRNSGDQSLWDQVEAAASLLGINR